MSAIAASGTAAVAAVEAALTALDGYAFEEADAPAGLPADCCGSCSSCQAAVAVTAAWPILVGGIVDQLTADGHPRLADRVLNLFPTD